MSKELPIKYDSEESVKKELNIDSFENITKEKVDEFISMMPYMDDGVATEIINQFPKFADFGNTAIDNYENICKEILKSNNTSQAKVIETYQIILKTLREMIKSPNLSKKDKNDIIKQMIDVADKVEEADLKNKKFLSRLFTKAGMIILATVATIGAAIGVSTKFKSDVKMEDEENDEEEYH